MQGKRSRATALRSQARAEHRAGRARGAGRAQQHLKGRCRRRSRPAPGAQLVCDEKPDKQI
eukprot:6583063-Alexandrium_andersonii.AAC.1